MRKRLLQLPVIKNCQLLLIQTALAAVICFLAGSITVVAQDKKDRDNNDTVCLNRIFVYKEYTDIGKSDQFEQKTALYPLLEVDRAEKGAKVLIKLRTNQAYQVFSPGDKKTEKAAEPHKPIASGQKQPPGSFNAFDTIDTIRVNNRPVETTPMRMESRYLAMDYAELTRNLRENQKEVFFDFRLNDTKDCKFAIALRHVH